MGPITNVHSHVFTAGCTPDYFLKTILPERLHNWADEIVVVLRSPRVRRLLERWAKWRGPFGVLRENSKLLRYIRFLEVGTQSTQEEVFRSMRKAYEVFGPDVRFVALTLNMDFMDVAPSEHARIDTQLAEIERVRAHYPDTFLPFVCVDPRHKSGADLRDWVKEKIERGAFVGIKMYPAIGFFPFDERLDELYAWAEEHGVPIMTHCTRVGTFYTGRMGEVVPDLAPAGLAPQTPQMASIHARIRRFRDNDFTWGMSKRGCNIFLHPENYEPVLWKYPGLKLCFAHFGGDDEMLKEEQPLRDKGIDPTNWHDEVVRIMSAQHEGGKLMHPNVYTDISYTLFRQEIYPMLQRLMIGPLGDRILFGTDFFMTLREDQEAALLERCITGLGMGNFRKAAAVNTATYLRSTFYQP